MTERATLVLGLGNPLMGDDGLGLAALEALRETYAFEPPVELVDGGTWGMNLLPLIETAGRVLLLDAININARPGTPVVLTREQIPRVLTTKLSPHQIDLKEVLAVAEFRGTLPDDTRALGLQPDRIEMSTQLSEILRIRLPELVDAAVDQLERWGHRAVPKAATTHA